jgi:uncharacterized membrane protein
MFKNISEHADPESNTNEKCSLPICASIHGGASLTIPTIFLGLYPSHDWVRATIFVVFWGARRAKQFLWTCSVFPQRKQTILLPGGYGLLCWRRVCATKVSGLQNLAASTRRLWLGCGLVVSGVAILRSTTIRCCNCSNVDGGV